MDTYIRAASQISMQQPLSEQWMDAPILPSAVFNEPIDPDYKQFISPAEARRMGRLLKRAVAASLDTLQKGNCTNPDAIITGTGLGCVENTEKFLNALIDNDEQCLPPTPFMQSTHNTISSQVALKLQCHGYNSTYSHRGTSFDSALLDAIMQFQLKRISTALIGGYDEMTPAYFKMLAKIGYWRTDSADIASLKQAGMTGSLACGAAVSLLLTNTHSPECLCRIIDTNLYYTHNTEEQSALIHAFLQQHNLSENDIDTVVCGFSGDNDNDSVYHHLLQSNFPDTTALWYKHLFGESFCASGYGIYSAAVCLKHQQIPEPLIYQMGQNKPSSINNILVINHFHKHDFSLTLLAPCSSSTPL